MYTKLKTHFAFFERDNEAKIYRTRKYIVLNIIKTYKLL